MNKIIDIFKNITYENNFICQFHAKGISNKIEIPSKLKILLEKFSLKIKKPTLALILQKKTIEFNNDFYEFNSSYFYNKNKNLKKNYFL